MHRLFRIFLIVATLISLVLMLSLFLLPERITLGRWFVCSAAGWIDIQKYSRPAISLHLPFRWVLLATLIFPAFWVVRRRIGAWIKHRPRRRGFCARCGYDLRATPDRCPECGRAT